MNKLDGPSKKRAAAVQCLWQSCLTCDMFKEKEETCTVYNVRPPARVIAYGCDAYTEDIPF